MGQATIGTVSRFSLMSGPNSEADFCLAHFLRGVSYSFATYPVSRSSRPSSLLLTCKQKSESTSGRETEQSDEDVSRGAREAEASFARVLANGAHVKVGISFRLLRDC